MIPDVQNDNTTEAVLHLIAETAHVSIPQTVTGKLRVSTTTEVVKEFARADLRSETIDVTRVPIGREVTQVPEIRIEGLLTIVPVIEEILVVEKRLVLKEELHIQRRTEIETVEVPIELRKQRAAIERVTDASEPSATE